MRFCFMNAKYFFFIEERKTGMRSEIWSAGTLTLECEKNIYTRAREKRESSQDCAPIFVCMYKTQRWASLPKNEPALFY